MVKTEFIILTCNSRSVAVIKRIFRKDEFKSLTLIVCEGVLEKIINDYEISFDSMHELNDKYNSVVNEYKNKGYK